MCIYIYIYVCLCVYIHWNHVKNISISLYNVNIFNTKYKYIWWIESLKEQHSLEIKKYFVTLLMSLLSLLTCCHNLMNPCINLGLLHYFSYVTLIYTFWYIYIFINYYLFILHWNDYIMMCFVLYNISSINAESICKIIICIFGYWHNLCETLTT